MVVFPNAKINLGLHITGKRPDGYHDIETLMYPVGFRDILEINPSATGEFGFHATGLPVPGDGTDNLCVSAYRLVSELHGIPPVRIHLHKIIPTGAGLGGGSSDAAFTITLLNEIFSLGLSGARMREYAGKLGSDCAFFIENRAAFATGRGDRLEPASPGLEGYSCMVVVPPVHVSTAEAYAGVTVRIPDVPIRSVILRPPAEWEGNLINDFEEMIFAKYPETCRVRDELRSAGAVYASMSGSGSALFGIFRRNVPSPSLFPGCITWSGRL
jgi:4-diphosphocytidyl-2-C-methyl-D-erythritol kinase